MPAVVIGNAAKAGVRFTTYDQFKGLLKDEEVGPWSCWRWCGQWAIGWALVLVSDSQAPLVAA